MTEVSEPASAPAFALTDRVCVVTGGGSGIGAAIAEGLVRAGARVAVLGRDQDRLAAFGAAMQARHGVAPLAVGTEVSDEASVTAAMDRVVETYGTIDGLVNNAGISKVGPSLEVDPADFRRILEVNVVGLFLCTQAAARVMVGHGRGSIVNVASMSAFIGQPERAAYVASKSAVVGITRSLAVEWGELGVRVNAIAPGYVRTDLVEGLIERGVLAPAVISGRTPLRRLGGTEDLVGGSLYLLSDLSGFVTGETLRIDGGWTANGYYK